MTFAGLISSEPNRHFTTRARRRERRRRTMAGRSYPVVATARAAADAAELQRAERNRIAGELHDTLLQGFSAVSMQLMAAVSELPADLADKPRFNNLVQAVYRVLEEGRLAVQGLRCPQQEQGLGHALAGIPELLGLAASVKFQVVVEGRERELEPELRDEIYHIGREAIVNAYRHSGARKIEAQIVFRPTELRVTVRDNGCGIDDRNLQCERIGHWGLQGMHERAKRIGAALRIMSRTAVGTDVELCVPGRVAFC